MALQNYKTANNAQGTLLSGISASATALILQTGQGGLFPSTFPYPLEIKEVDTALNNYRVLKREIVLCTGRTGDTLTITRAFEACPNDYTATTQLATAFSFSNPASTVVTNSFTAWVAKDLTDAIAWKMDTVGGLGTWYGTNKHKRVNLSTGADEIKPVTASVWVISTDKIRIEKVSGDYEDATVAQLTASTSGLTSEYIMGGTANANESVYLSALDKFKNTATPFADIGKTTATTSFKMYASGNTEQRYSFFFTKTLSPQDLTFRIETDNAGAPSGTLVNANAVLVTAIASITSGAVYEIVLPASFVPAVAGTPIWFVFWQGSQAINATNYLSIGINAEVSVVHDRVTSPGSNLTATRVVGGGAGTTSNATWVQQIDANVDCQLMSLGFSYVPATTLFEVFNITDNFTIYKDPVAQTGVTLNEPVKLIAGKRYELRYTFNNTLNNISSHNTVVNTANINWVNGTAGGNTITSIVTRTATFTPNAGVLFTYISKALATLAIKAVVYGLLPASASAGSYPSIKKSEYQGGFSWLIKGTTYYLSNTWVISSTAGTVSKVLGVAINSTTIRIDSAINAS